MDATLNFRRNFKKILKQQNYTLASFAERIEMDVSKIQRLQDVRQTGAIALNDADKIASELNTTLGYMCGNTYTDFMLDQTKMMRDYFSKISSNRHTLVDEFIKDRTTEKEILDYLDEILGSVDSLKRKAD
jgi:transcriptional regulator with XRE-family HTH domain